MDKQLRGVMVGAGFFAKIQLEAWTDVNGGDICGLYDLDSKKASRIGAQFGVTSYNSWDQMIKEVQPDFIDICTPPSTHLEYTKLGADLGIPVLCQKPLAPTYEEGEALVQYCRKQRVPLMVNENWRWQAWYREIKTMIDKGMLGKVYTSYFAMRPGDGWGDQPYPVQPYFKEMDRFLIFETGVHFIDTFRYLFGEIESVYCQTRTINSCIKGEDFALIHFNFEGGTTAIYDANRTTFMEEVRTPTFGIMTLEGTEGKLRLQENGRIYYTPRAGQEREHNYVIPKKGWKGGCTVATQQHFINSLTSNMPFETSGEDYLKTFHIVFACYESAKHNRVVNLLKEGMK